MILPFALASGEREREESGAESLLGYLPASHRMDSEMEVWKLSQLLGPIWEWWQGIHESQFPQSPPPPERVGIK